MGEYKNQGDAAAALMEECSEVIQVIAKFKRFGGEWYDIPEGKKLSRWMMLEEEMEDLLFQWERLKQQRADEREKKFSRLKELLKGGE